MVAVWTSYSGVLHVSRLQAHEWARFPTLPDVAGPARPLSRVMERVITLSRVLPTNASQTTITLTGHQSADLSPGLSSLSLFLSATKALSFLGILSMLSLSIFSPFACLLSLVPCPGARARAPISGTIGLHTAFTPLSPFVSSCPPLFPYFALSSSLHRDIPSSGCYTSGPVPPTPSPGTRAHSRPGPVAAPGSGLDLKATEIAPILRGTGSRFGARVQK
ncbi:hypothetical protein N7462_011453 [Penicillium macrosclerotiorum]|uniref:uncharacterized protein n=1 Tax=Penicillium macrosclerotiorum TaxID=303699 RepID=UPI002547A1E7|nr:uncharacterized protein N7462_011453 [Penicillium macrosclerotiorum]KAJ5664640.1 hypothetical protein N7462_011453 [Penicillium macrosclerotiorum]